MRIRAFPICACLGLLTLVVHAADAAPANDNFANAQVLTGTAGSGSGTTVGATVESGEPSHGGYPAVNSVWYAWTAPADGALTFSKVDPYGPDVGIYVGDSVDQLTQVVPQMVDSRFNLYTISVRQGVTYRMSVNIGANGASFSYSWSFFHPPANDNFASAQVLSGWSGSVSGTTEDATVERAEPAIDFSGSALWTTSSGTVWYSWTAPSSGPVVFQGTGITFLGAGIPHSHVYTGNAVDFLTELVSPRWSYISFKAEAGVRYSIQIIPYQNPFQLTWSPGPANDDFANAAVISGTSGSLTTSNRGATAESGEPLIWGTAAEETMWYQWSAPQDGVYSFHFAAQFPPLFAIYAGDQLNQLMLVGASPYDISLRATAGTTYRIMIGRNGAPFAPGDGSFTLSWRQGTSTDLTLLNLSTRGKVGLDEDVLIGGFILRGSTPKKVMLRAIGPSLQANGVSATDCLADPQLELHNANGDLVFSNDDWITSSQKQEIIDSTIPPKSDKESAMIASLEPGNYTGVLRGANKTKGIGLIEIYDLQRGSATRLLNVSTRGFVARSPDALIGGFIIGGSVPAEVLLRALGPSLSNANPPVPNALPDPLVHVHNSAGSFIGGSDNWRGANYTDPQLAQSGLGPPSNSEAALVMTLQPGAYTAIVENATGDPGIGLVEIYNLNP